MIAHSIECAIRTELFSRVIVSTDDDEIARIAREYGAEVPYIRPPELSDDHAGTVAVIAHAIEYLHAGGEHPDSICCLYATAPFVAAQDIKRGDKIFESGQWDFVFSATTYSAPVFRSFVRNPDGGLRMLFPEHFSTRSQDLTEVLHDAGQFYWGSPSAWCAGRAVFGPSSTVVLVPSWRVQDIDTPEDWIRAEYVMSLVSNMDSHA